MGPLTDITTDQAPADPAATDDMLATRPIGYWSGLAHVAVTRHLRDAMARIDVTQPQYWVLNRVNGGPAASSREEAVIQLTPLADGPHEIARVIDQGQGMPGDFRQPGRALHPFRSVREPGQVHHDDEFLAIGADPGFLADQARRGRVADRAEADGLVPQHLAGPAERAGVRCCG